MEMPETEQKADNVTDLRQSQARTPAAERDSHVEAFKASGKTRKAYAKSAGISEKNLSNWLYRDKIRSASFVVRTPKKEVVHDPVSEKDNQIAALTYQRDELMQKLEDANLKVKSLMNLLILAGHQIGDE
jgi:hypothetical protein